jgi:hypothetical protein
MCMHTKHFLKGNCNKFSIFTRSKQMIIEETTEHMKKPTYPDCMYNHLNHTSPKHSNISLKYFCTEMLNNM